MTDIAAPGKPGISPALTAVLIAAVSLLGLLAWAALSIKWPPLAINTRVRLLPPFTQLPGGSFSLFGTDQLGRDVFRLVLEGARTSLLISFTAALISAIFGSTMGVLAGWVGGRTEAVVMRIVDVQLSFPSILIAVFLAAFVTPSVLSVVLVLAVTRWALVARLTRAITVKARRRGYVEAALVSGFSLPKILWSCIIPNVMAPLLIVVTAEISELILAEAALGFLGLGLPSDVISWGQVISSGRNYLDNAWWIASLPGLTIAVMVITIGALSEQLRIRLTVAGRTLS